MIRGPGSAGQWFVEPATSNSGSYPVFHLWLRQSPGKCQKADRQPPELWDLHEA